jgi:hypothetical protein
MIASIEINSETDPRIPGSFGYKNPTAPVPTRISVLAGESIQALRRALDYLIFELAYLDSGRIQDGTQFPIDQAKYKFWQRLTRVKGGPAACLLGVSRKHATVIERCQPYEGTQWTKALQTISNPDKHRHLTVARTHESTRIFAHRPAKDRTQIRRLYNGFTARWPAMDDVDVKLQITLSICLDDGTRVVDTLNEIRTNVLHMVEEFRPCFRGQCLH